MKVRKSAPKLSASQRKKWLTLLQSSAVKSEPGALRNNSYRIVVDTNIWYSGILYGGAASRVLEHALSEQELIISDYIAEEIVGNLRLVIPKISHRWLKTLRSQFLQYSHDDTIRHHEKIRDINDEPVIRLAIKYNALIVTGDKDLLEYKAKAKITILSVTDYIEIFALQ